MTYLYQLSAMAEFNYQGVKYRVIAPIKQTIVNRCRAGQKREVINLQTNKTERLPYYTEVTEVSEIFENPKN